MKRNILFMFTGLLIGIVITGAVYAISASEITYNNTTVEGALDNLYILANDNYVYGTQESIKYSSYESIDLGFEPKVVVAIIPTSGGYLRACAYTENGENVKYQRSYSLINSNDDCINVTESGFNWYVYDSSWGSQTIYYYAFK